MSNITTYLKKILSARFGEDVRQAIHDAINSVNSEASSAIKPTDYATVSKAGIVKLHSTSSQNNSGLQVDIEGGLNVNVPLSGTGNAGKYGLERDGAGQLKVTPATASEVSAGTNEYKPIVPKTLKTVTDKLQKSIDDIATSEGNVAVDDTLTKEGYAADAKATGAHTSNANIHVTTAEKNNWNNHVLNSNAHVTLTEKVSVSSAVENLNYWNVTYGVASHGIPIAYVQPTTEYIPQKTYIFTPSQYVQQVIIRSTTGSDVASVGGGFDVGYAYLVDFRNYQVIAVWAAGGDTDIVALKTDLTSCYNYYGVCETAADNPAKSVTISNLNELSDGALITIQFLHGARGTAQNDGASISLRINGLDAYEIRFNGVDSSAMYDSTSLIVEGNGTLSLVFHTDDEIGGYFTCPSLQYVFGAVMAETSSDAQELKQYLDSFVTAAKVSEDSETEITIGKDFDDIVKLPYAEFRGVAKFFDEIDSRATAAFRDDLDIHGATTIYSGADVTIQNGTTFQFGNGRELSPAEIMEAIGTSYNVTDSTVSLTLTNNADHACGELTSLTVSVSPNSSGRCISAISFTSGATATNFVYPDGWLWKGDDCEDYVFVPQANTYYEMIIEYRNGVVTGYVAGFETTESEE